MVKSEGLSTKATDVTDEGRLKVCFVLKRCLVEAKECFQSFRFKSIRIFKSLFTRKFIMKKELRYFSYDLKETTNLSKLSKARNLQLWNSNRESTRVSWFSFKACNAKWLVIHSRLRRFYWYDEKNRKSSQGFLSVYIQSYNTKRVF